MMPLLPNLQLLKRACIEPAVHWERCALGIVSLFCATSRSSHVWYPAVVVATDRDGGWALPSAFLCALA